MILKSFESDELSHKCILFRPLPLSITPNHHHLHLRFCRQRRVVSSLFPRHQPQLAGHHTQAELIRVPPGPDPGSRCPRHSSRGQNCPHQDQQRPVEGRGRTGKSRRFRANLRRNALCVSFPLTVSQHRRADSLRLLFLLPLFKEIVRFLINIKVSKPAIPPFLSVLPTLTLLCFILSFSFLWLTSSCLFRQHVKGL